MCDADQARDRAPKTVFCRRLKRSLPVTEHEQCNYCFGPPDAIATGEHDTFCDFCEGKDPVHFGFPETHGRFRA